MQRRAAALYVSFFLIAGAASFGLVATATAPQLSFENPEHELSEGDSFTVEGTEYTVASINASEGSGEGSEGEVTLSASLEYTNESYRYTQTWENGSVVTFEGEDWNVRIGGENATRVELVEVIDRSAILRNDSTVDNETVTSDGTEYVVRREDGNRTLIPADEYFPEPETQVFQEGETLQYQGNTTTVATIQESGATLAWTAPNTLSVEIANEANITVSGVTYFAYLPDEETLVLTTQFDQYREFQKNEQEFRRTTNGLWGITIVSGFASVLLVGLAYLPSRY